MRKDAVMAAAYAADQPTGDAGDRAAGEVSFPSDTDILITRVFNVPRESVFRAWTTPELVRRWWGGNRGTMTVADMDLRVGGSWRYVLRTRDGSLLAFHGKYREVVPLQRLVYTEVFEGQPEAQAQTTVTFEEAGGVTTVAILIRYDSREQRDAHRQYMVAGLHEALDRLEQTARHVAGGVADRRGERC
jgi:uncharacterized protein YndB with AHSA1/START domain